MQQDKINSRPRVSVVTVCYNAADHLDATAASVAALTYPNLEYIVVDGGSTDRTHDVLKSYEHIVDKSVSGPDRGIYDAMNKGVVLSTGEWIIFMNAGDSFAAPDVLERVFEQPLPPDTAVVYGDVVKAYANGSRVLKTASEPRNSHRMFFCHQSALTRRELLVRHPFDLNHRMSADFKLFKTLINAGERFVHVPLPVAVFDTGGVSNTRRSAGLADNIAVISETDGLADRLRLLPRLYFTYIMCRLRGK